MVRENVKEKRDDGMKIFARMVILIVLVASLWGWWQSSPSLGARPQVSEIARNFTNYQRMTKDPVDVDPWVAMLCRGLTPEMVEQIRLKSGPHALMKILVYMNQPAALAFQNNQGSYPVGAVIVKQKQKSYISGEGVGGMVKRANGYDPENGNWEYFYFEDVNKIESGKIASCIKCHASVKNQDYVFGNWSKPNRLTRR
jgi:Cytochrome P460